MRLLTALSGCLALGLALLPHIAVWDNGGMLPWTRYWLAVAIGVLGVFAVPVIFWRRGIKSYESLGVPCVAILFWCVALGQTVPLAGGLVGWLSPGSFDAYTQWVPAAVWEIVGESTLPRLGGQSAERFPVSVCAWLTRQALMTPALFGFAAFLAMFTFQSRQTLLFLMAVTAAAGGLFSFLALIDTVQAISPGANPNLITPDIRYGAPFGSFVNKNSSALYMNLGLACTLGLLVHGVATRRRSFTGDEEYELPVQNKLDALRLAAERFLRDADAMAVGLVMLGVLQFVGILASNSRGGFLASLAGVAVATIASQKKAKYLWTIVPLLLSAVAVISLLDHLNLTEKTQDRVESIFTLEEGSQVGRLAHWKDSLSAAASYFPAGSGLGTYSVAYLPFQTEMGDNWFYNADNMFMEWLVEGGVWMLACVAVGTVILVRALGRIKMVRGAPHLQGIAAMGWFLIGMMCVSQFFDFGILYPSNLLTAGILVGAILGADARPYHRRTRLSKVVEPLQSDGAASVVSVEKGRQLRWERLRSVAVVGLMLGYLGIGVLTIRWASEGAWADYKIRSLKPDTQSGVGFSEFAFVNVDAEEFMSTGGSGRSESPFVRLATANAILSKQVAKAVEQAPTNLSVGDMERFQAMSKIELRRVVFYEEAKRRGRKIKPEEVLLAGQSLEELRTVRRLSSEALVQCPLDVRSRWGLLVTSFVEDDPPEFSQLLADQVVGLWPNTAMVISRIARLIVPFPGSEAASPLFARVLELRPSEFGKLWPLMQTASDEAMILKSLPDDPEALLVAIESSWLSDSMRQALIQRANESLKQASGSIPEERRAILRGRIAIRSGDRAVALASFGDAVRLDPTNAEVRFLYAEALEAKGDIEGAIEQVKRCLVQAPQNGRYLEGMRRLTRGK